MKLRDVDIIISGTKTGDTYYAKSYPCSDMDKNSKIELYGVPVYYVYIKGTDDKGQSVKYTWKALRFMPYYNPPNFSSYKQLDGLIVACISSIGSLRQNIKKPMKYIIHILNIMVQ